MDGYGFRRRDREIGLGGSHHHYPSFSSTLLDEIYRSIDGDDGGDSMRIKQSKQSNKQSNTYSVLKGSCKSGEFTGGGERVVVRRKSAAEMERIWNSSSSGSSDSSSGGGFSSSEAESVYGVAAGSSCYGLNRPKPKPVRTGNDLISSIDLHHHHHQNHHHYPPPVKTKKSRALKIYGDLKKVKQPISPGGRLATFLNSIFTAKKAAAAKIDDRKVKSANASTCSSASSFSRSCLSKNTPNTTTAAAAGKPAGKRSVRFFPVSVIVGEDSRPCGHKNLDISETNHHRVEAAARDLLRNYQKKLETEFDFNNLKSSEDDDDDDDDDDVASYASSDLFELDNLSAIGMERYSEELPVYETTHLPTNRAIASGLIL